MTSVVAMVVGKGWFVCALFGMYYDISPEAPHMIYISKRAGQSGYISHCCIRNVLSYKCFRS